jgi:hypothetical protein
MIKKLKIKKYPKPTIPEDYLKGIIRGEKGVYTYESGHWWYLSSKFILGNDLSLYWHSELDLELRQYVDVIFIDKVVEVTSYHFHTGFNGPYYSNTWNLTCTLDGEKITTIDTQINNSIITSSNQSIIFDTIEVVKCRHFRFRFPGNDSLSRAYSYMGPLDFYGTVYSNYSFCTAHCLRNINILELSCFILFYTS